MTPKERAEDLIRRFDEPVRDRGNHRVQAMINMVEEAIIAAVNDVRPTWQPIDTAPKDGTWILLRGKNSVGRPMIPVVVAWSYGHGLSEPPCWRDSANLKDLTDLAASSDGAEWMPLP